VRISRDGTRIAFLAPVDGVLNLWIGPIERIEEARPVTTATDRNLGLWIVWMHDNRHVLFFRDKAGDENWCAFAIDVESGEVRALTPQTGVTCGVQQLSRDFAHPIKFFDRNHIFVRRNLKNTVAGSVDNRLACPYVFLTQFLDDFRSGSGLVADRFAANLLFKPGNQIGRKPFLVNGKGFG